MYRYTTLSSGLFDQGNQCVPTPIEKIQWRLHVLNSLILQNLFQFLWGLYRNSKCGNHAFFFEPA
ncbi:hypothetical protein D3C77_625000 [compost metagenome]